MDLDRKTFIPGRDKLEKGESLAPDSSAYELLHTLSTTWPCLSFAIVPDTLGDARKTYPATLYAVGGTQAESRRKNENKMLVIKLSSLSRTERVGAEDESSDEEDDDDEENAEPILETRNIPLNHTSNRIRVRQFTSEELGSNKSPQTYAATLLESAELVIHDITPHLASFDTPGSIITPQQSRPLATIKCHRSEGYALAWSHLYPTGKILSGDNEGNIYLTTQEPNGKWIADSRPFTGHNGSVEDIEWSPNERTVFASASSDGSVKIWDTRGKTRRPAVSVTVSDSDINVLSWSKLTPHLLATGADNGEWAVWDLRQWKPSKQGDQIVSPPADAPKPVAKFSFHKEQITSVEWHPSEDSIVAIAAGDHTLTLWDLAVELDDEESKDTADVKDVPPQLLFVHYMEDVKECHWHAQIPGTIMATGSSGFGVFKTISV